MYRIGILMKLHGEMDETALGLTNEKDHHYFLNSADVCW